MSKYSFDEIVSHLKSSGFIYQNSEIYGGLSNSWDYGIYGSNLKKNIKDLWWNEFIVKSPYNVGNNNIYAGSSYGDGAILDNVGGNTVSNNKGQIFNGTINAGGSMVANGSSNYQNDAILSDDSDVNGASDNGAVDYGLVANALSSAGIGSGDVASTISLIHGQHFMLVSFGFL